MIRFDVEQQLFIVRAGEGYTCLGLEFANRRARGVADWLGLPVETITGDAAGWARYLDIMARGDAHRAATGERCPAELTPQLLGLEGRRVEVIDAYGERRRFVVGRSTGWMPCHLEMSGRGRYGDPVSGAPFRSVVVVK